MSTQHTDTAHSHGTDTAHSHSTVSTTHRTAGCRPRDPAHCSNGVDGQATLIMKNILIIMWKSFTCPGPPGPVCSASKSVSPNPNPSSSDSRLSSSKPAYSCVCEGCDGCDGSVAWYFRHEQDVKSGHQNPPKNLPAPPPPCSSERGHQRGSTNIRGQVRARKREIRECDVWSERERGGGGSEGHGWEGRDE